MNRVRAAMFRDLQNLVDVEIGLTRSRGANGIGLVCHQYVQGDAIHLGINRNRKNPQLAAGPNDPHRDLPPVGNENLLEHDDAGASAPLVLPDKRSSREECGTAVTDAKSSVVNLDD